MSYVLGQVSNMEKGVMGTGAHSDYGVMTMMATVSADVV